MSEVSTKVSDLPIEQAAALWCLRLWVAGKHGFQGASERIARMAAQLDIADAAHFLEDYMVALNQGATRSIEIGCLRCPHIGGDERMLLDALGLAQECRTFEAMLVLRRAFEDTAIRNALHNAEGLGRALACVGRFLPAPATTVQPDVTTWFITTNP